MPPLSDFSKFQLAEILVEQVKKTDQAWSDHCDKLIKVIKQSRDDIWQAAVILKETMNANSIIGTDIYERLRKTHELLRVTVEMDERKFSEEPK